MSLPRRTARTATRRTPSHRRAAPPRAPRRLAPVAVLGALVLAATGTAVLAPGPVTATPAPVTPAFAAQLVRVDVPSQAARSDLQGLGLDLTEHAGPDFVEVLLHTAAERAVLQEAGFTYDVVIADLPARQAEINDLDRAYAARVATSPLPSGRTGYRTLEDYETDMAALAADHPRLARSVTLPHLSLDGREVHGIEIGSDVSRPASGRPTFLLMGLHHAREWPSGENAMEFAVDLVQSYGEDERITRLLRRARVLVVPVVNVDGFVASRTDGDLLDLRDLNAVDPTGDLLSVLLTPGQTYKRKNCRVLDGVDTPDGSCAATLASPGGFGLGVDLNRNYAGFWGGPGAAGPTPSPTEVDTGVLDPTYRGAAPFSEPETLNIHDLVAERQVTMLISNHTSGDLILRPNGVSPETIGPDGLPVGDAPDEKALERLGARMAAQNGYANIHGWELYDTTGTTEDWSYNATGGFGYTFEIGPDEFHPPFEDVVGQYLGTGDHAGKGNRAAYLLALEHAVSRSANARLVGTAPRGATLRLTKSFDTPTWEGTYADRLDSTLAVGRDGRFTWTVNPSTRPVSRPRTATLPDGTEVAQPGRTEAYTLTCEVGGEVRQRLRVVVDRGQTRRIDLRGCRR